MTAHAYDYSSISGANATGASISGYESAIAISVLDFGADDTGKKDAAPAIQKALDYAGEHSSDSVQVKVIVPEGTYSIGSCLWVHSNTWFYMQGATLRKDFSGGCMIMNYRDDLGGGFNGSCNIIIEGGTLDGNTYGGSVKAFSTIRMGHLHDLWVKNVDFKDNYNCHLLELGGIKNVTIEGCSFHEYYGAKYKEAIQFDILNNDNLFDGYAPFDDTPCDNVIIRNNNFYDLMRGLGSHSATIGEYYTNFLITDNTFNNIYDSAMIMENYRCCTIENNTMTNVGSGIDFKNMTYLEYSGYNAPVAGYGGVYDKINDFSDTIIRGNNIVSVITGDSPKPFGVNLYGKLVQSSSFPDHDYKVEGVLIESNNITTAGCAVQMTDTNGIILSSNIFGTTAEGDKYENNLLNIKYSDDVTVKDNSLMNSIYHGIAVVGGTNNNIIGNTCLNSAACGITADKNAVVKITNNTIESSSKSAIAVKGGASAEIKNNTITGTDASGVKIEGSTDVKVTDNTISGCGVAGINAADGGCAYVDANSFSENAGETYKGQVMAMPITDLTADGVYGDHVQLSWISRGGSDGYSVKRRQLDIQSDFEEVAVVTTPSFIDEDIPSNTRFEYRIDTLLDTGNSITESDSDVLSVRTKAPMSECTSDLRPVYRYSGRKIEPDMNVYLGGCKLRRGVDYKVKMYNNIAAGKATAVVTGCGEYFGFREFEFDISLTEGFTANSSKNSVSAFGGKNTEKYEVIAVSAAEAVKNALPSNRPTENSDLLKAISSAKSSDNVRIYSRRVNASVGMTGYGLWF
ncbi:right-handed parallel beta-helix repeat-containing protein [uncultured Ruminococcus sp.]|uniref:right-handed parallel beta-helix repeat-containing protein n=1 Tax=uncultured Ruminococcus sp. TaxID=165186 RepID=UPI0025E998CA|nr:right-handed parallel beta-helix repeat-containing protein [uncultured Ruminococcus sp.]